MGETRETPQRPGDPVLWEEGQSLCYPRNPPSEVLAPAPAQIALAPYQHLEEDMQSLKQVLEMKNQQIHLQEKKIIELEKLVEKNIILEERIQVLQQQNEDLKARIDQNTVVTRQLSEENANLQEYVEKETQEKKRLSRTNEELLWKLQTGDPTSPIKLSPTSPVYRGSSSGPSSPARVSTTPR